jgi:hypothetical protein
MKKFLIVLGSIFLALIVLGGIGIAFTAIKGTALDKESKAYADSAIRAIVTTWSEKECSIALARNLERQSQWTS